MKNFTILIKKKACSPLDDEINDDWLNELLEIKNDVYSLLGKTFGRLEKGQKLERAENYIGNKLKLERMKLPLFSGEVREYPSLKTNFERYIEPKLDPSDIAYAGGRK